MQHGFAKGKDHQQKGHLLEDFGAASPLQNPNDFLPHDPCQLGLSLVPPPTSQADHCWSLGRSNTKMFNTCL
jgi:hypothetical protein